MKVKELIEKLRQPYKVEMREDNYFLCETTTNNKTVELFYEREVYDWFPVERGLGLAVGICINLISEEA